MNDMREIIDAALAVAEAEKVLEAANAALADAVAKIGGASAVVNSVPADGAPKLRQKRKYTRRQMACEVCGRKFVPTHEGQRACSAACVMALEKREAENQK